MKRLFFLFLIISLSTYSQELSHTDYPRLIPPSPEVSSLFRFVDYSVNHSTGLVEISIPLYTVKCGTLSLPISIDYHASGRRYNDITGAVGLGWLLNAGGIISRTVYGFPDEIKPVPNTLKESKSISMKTDYSYLAGLYYHYLDYFGAPMDAEYDLFSYSLPKFSGHFVFEDHSPKSLTLNAVKIEKSGSLSEYNSEFIITGEDGIKYIFGDPESSTISTQNVTNSVNTAWFLKEIRSPDGKHFIRLSYENVNLTTTDSYSTTCSLVNETMILNDAFTLSYQTGVGSAIDYRTNSVQIAFKSKRLKEIDFGTGKIHFDIENIGGKIKKMYIKDTSGTVVKTYEFTHLLLDKTDMNNYKLDQMSCTSGTNKSDIYRFEYYPTRSSFRNSQRDYWGYINSNSNNSFIPTFEANLNRKKTTVGHYGVDREPNETEMKSGVLKQIIYPTGNKTEYIYEINKYYSGNNVKNGPGLRIKQVKTTDDSGKVQLRTFQYNVAGNLMNTPEIRYWGLESLYLDVGGSINEPDASSYNGHYRQRIFSSEIPQDISYYGEQPIFYSMITEYRGDQIQNTGKTVYHYRNPYNDSYLYYIPSPIYPSYHPAYYPSTIPYSFEYDSASSHYPYTYQWGSLWKMRNLYSQIDYENVNGIYNEIKSTTYEYKELSAPSLKCLKIYKYIQFKNDYDHKTEEFFATDFGFPVFLFSNYYITRGRELLSSITEKETRHGNSISTTRAFMYDSNYLLKNDSLKNSSGICQVEKTHYPSDDEYKNQDVYKRMIQLNMLNIPIKKSIVRNGNVNSLLTDYMEYGSNFIKPSQIMVQKNNNAPTIRIQYHRYDSYGNPIEITTENMMKIIYLWGYNGMYPIAKIENATYEEVKDALGNLPESLSSSSTYDSRIDNLRTSVSLQKAHVTLYKYKPLVGIISITSPTGLTTIYTYDLFNRLQKVSIKKPNDVEKVIEIYDYNYRTN